MTSVNNQDERIAKRASLGDARADRLLQNREISGNRENADNIRAEERHAMLRDVNTVLPVPPPIDGYHLSWLTTTNNKDTLEQRFRLGYSLVHPSEMPNFKFDTQKSGNVTQDRIQVNEMVLAKIPMDLWLGDMKYLHHDLPLQDMQNLKNSVSIQEDGKGRKIGYTGGDFNNGVSDGYASLGKMRAPTFAGIQ